MSWTGNFATSIGLIVVVGLGCVAARTCAEIICPPVHVAASDPFPFDNFGRSLAVSGDVALIGAYQAAIKLPGDEAGAAYVFRRAGGSCAQEQKLTAADAQISDAFGFAVAIEGDVAVIGSIGPDKFGIASGAAYVFRFNPQLMQWQQEQKLLLPDNGGKGEHFGSDVALQETTIVVGSEGDNGAGSVYIYGFAGARWELRHMLTASDGKAGDGFGFSISIDGDAMLIGAPGVGAFTSGGAAYVFQFDGARWVEQAKLIAQDPGPGGIIAGFGEAVAITVEKGGELQALIGAPNHELPGMGQAGAAYFFRGRGRRWQQEQQFFASDPDDSAKFGKSLARAGDHVVIGAVGSDAAAFNNGAAYLFHYDPLAEQWVQQQQLLPPVTGVTFTPFFGRSVGFDGDTIIIGANGEGPTIRLGLPVLLRSRRRRPQLRQRRRRPGRDDPAAIMGAGCCPWQ